MYINRQYKSVRAINSRYREFTFRGVPFRQLNMVEAILDAYGEAGREPTYPDASHDLSIDIFPLPDGLLLCGMIQRDRDNPSSYTLTMQDLGYLDAEATPLIWNAIAEFFIKHAESYTTMDDGHDDEFWRRVQHYFRDEFMRIDDAYHPMLETSISEYFLKFSAEDYQNFGYDNISFEMFEGIREGLKLLLLMDGRTFIEKEFDADRFLDFSTKSSEEIEEVLGYDSSGNVLHDFYNWLIESELLE